MTEPRGFLHAQALSPYASTNGTCAVPASMGAHRLIAPTTARYGGVSRSLASTRSKKASIVSTRTIGASACPPSPMYAVAGEGVHGSNT
jgi:hypothetical protein